MFFFCFGYYKFIIIVKNKDSDMTFIYAVRFIDFSVICSGSALHLPSDLCLCEMCVLLNLCVLDIRKKWKILAIIESA